VAHNSYLDGLKKTGIEIDNIPSMYGMNRILTDIGWAASGGWLYSAQCFYGVSGL
jgi:phenylalanine-4-hydroxylase